MHRRLLGVVVLVATLALSTTSPALAGNSNTMVSTSKPLVVTQVLTQYAHPDASNFDEEFTYDVVRFEPVVSERFLYREPARLGGETYDVPRTLGPMDSFWFGVSRNDGGIQQPIVHKGTAWVYVLTEDGTTRHLKAEFSDSGELLRVNGVAPTP